MNPLKSMLCLALALSLASCATETFAPGQAPELVVIRGFTPFYRNGPMQARGPDASLTVDTRVKLLRKEMGYSLVQLEDSRTGYVANENLAPAPPRPPEPPPAPEPTPSSRRKRGSSGPAYRGEQINDTQLPDRNLPPPDLNIGPEDVPAATPTPKASPGKPKFRI